MTAAAPPRWLLGIDLGTTSVKGGLFEASGAMVAQAVVRYPTQRPRPGWVEQSPQDWLDAFWHIVDELMAGRQLQDLAAVGICSQVNTHVFVDARGRALAPAIVWQDRRTAAQAEQLDAQVSAEERERWWGAAMAVGASHTLPRMAWMREHHPAVWRKTARVLSPKDFLLHHLTGRWTADPLSAFDLVDGAGRLIAPLVERVPGAGERLAPLHGYQEVIGTATHPRFEGSPAVFVAGTMDAFTGLIGCGAAAPGEGAYLSGTSEIVALIGGRPGAQPGIVSFLPQHGWYVQAGPTQSGGDTLRWLAGVLGQSTDAVLQAAARARREGEAPLFLPHLQGERAPFWDMNARGTFLGLTSDMGMPEMALAALEGVACSARLVLEAAQRATGQRPQALFLGGGGAQSDLWSQLRADILGIPMKRVRCLDTGVVGAAITAGVGAGLFASVEEGARRLVSVERVFQPDPSQRARHDRIVERYVAAYTALKPFYRA